MKKTLKKSGIIVLLAVYLIIFTTPAAHAYIDPSASLPSVPSGSSSGVGRRGN